MPHVQLQKILKMQKSASVLFPCLRHLTFGFILLYVKDFGVNKAFILVIILVSVVT
jgi:hypothetical protein